MMLHLNLMNYKRFPFFIIIANLFIFIISSVKVLCIVNKLQLSSTNSIRVNRK